MMHDYPPVFKVASFAVTVKFSPRRLRHNWTSVQLDFAISDSLLGGKAVITFCAADVCFGPKPDICGNILDLSFTRVKNWTFVQLDFSAHNQDNQTRRFRAGSAVRPVLSCVNEGFHEQRTTLA